jgi:hypothetical protein
MFCYQVVKIWPKKKTLEKKDKKRNKTKQNTDLQQVRMITIFHTSNVIVCPKIWSVASDGNASGHFKARVAVRRTYPLGRNPI